jgi:hypothetical protein
MTPEQTEFMFKLDAGAAAMESRIRSFMRILAGDGVERAEFLWLAETVGQGIVKALQAYEERRRPWGNDGRRAHEISSGQNSRDGEARPQSAEDA